MNLSVTVLGNLDQFGPSVLKAATAAARKAGSSALRKMKSSGQKDTRDRYKLKASRVREGLPTNKGGRDLGGMYWLMRVSGAPVPVVEYPHRQVKAGVEVEIKTGHRALIKSAFVATMRSGHVGVFRRRGKSRLPIDELFSTRLSDVFKNSDFSAAVMTKAVGEFDKTFARVYPLELDKLGFK